MTSYWGLILKPGFEYSRKITQGFRISSASLDTSCASEEITSVILRRKNTEHILCNLSLKHGIQAPLDLQFDKGEDVCLYVRGGKADVHLNGVNRDYNNELKDINKDKSLNGVKESYDETFSKEEEDSGEEEPEGSGEEVSDEEEEIEEEEEDEVSENDEEEDEENSDEDMDNEIIENIKKRKEVKVNEKDENPQKKLKIDKTFVKTSPKDGKVSKTEQVKKHVKAGGVLCEDLVVGSGKEAKKGQMIHVYYEGRLKNGKVFDKQTSGPPLKFRLGANEVIKGLEVGVDGMKVGGRRRLTIPPNMGYGKKGAAPAIPPNSVLMFDIQLKVIK